HQKVRSEALRRRQRCVVRLSRRKIGRISRRIARLRRRYRKKKAKINRKFRAAIRRSLKRVKTAAGRKALSSKKSKARKVVNKRKKKLRRRTRKRLVSLKRKLRRARRGSKRCVSRRRRSSRRRRGVRVRPKTLQHSSAMRRPTIQKTNPTNPPPNLQAGTIVSQEAGKISRKLRAAIRRSSRRVKSLAACQRLSKKRSKIRRQPISERFRKRLVSIETPTEREHEEDQDVACLEGEDAVFNVAEDAAKTSAMHCPTIEQKNPPNPKPNIQEKTLLKRRVPTKEALSEESNVLPEKRRPASKRRSREKPKTLAQPNRDVNARDRSGEAKTLPTEREWQQDTLEEK
uniref:Serine/arginine repetitive matrix protein 2 n=1 Tax=Macrostomum lignano TaxID=282301 RepID=A0A1I8FTR7_9PLAT